MNDWAVVVLSSFSPVGAGGLVLREDEIDWRGAWHTFIRGLGAKARLGAFLGVLIAISSPLWSMGRFVTLARFSIEARAAQMDALLRHRVYIVRELALMLKVCACMALFRSNELRARTSYDRPVRVRLPMSAPAAKEAAA